VRTVGLALALALLGSACALPTPSHERVPDLKLAPAAFGGEVSLAQRLTLKKAPSLPSGSETTSDKSLDALLEINARSVHLAAFALGQRVLTLSWDGTLLHTERSAFLPTAIDGAQVLRDIELVYWPLDALQAALPVDWTVADLGATRVLKHHEEPAVTIRYAGEPHIVGTTDLDNLAEGYRLQIESMLAGAP
jgi:hypothetical protein